MSTQAQHMGGQNMWDQPQFTFKLPLQLEEHPYPFETTSSAKRFPQQRSLNVPASSGRYSPYPSTVPFGTSSGFVRRPSMRTSSFDPLGADVNLALDTSSSSFGVSSHSARVSPVYNQPNVNALEPNPAPESSPNPNPAATIHSTSHSYLPAGPMQFSTPLPLPPRQSELQAHYFNAPYPRTQQESLPNLKRAKSSEDHDDSQGEQLDAQEQEATRPKPSVDLASRFLGYQLMISHYSSGACSRCKSLKVDCNARQYQYLMSAF